MTLQKWFESQERDYGIGLVLLGKYSKNRILLQNLSRKQNPLKLEYELRKFYIQRNPEKIINTSKEKPQKREDDLSRKRDEFGKAAENILVGKLKIIRNNKEVKFNDLPEELQKKWKENRDGYKKIRSLHEKLKLMRNATSKERQPLLDCIAKLDATIRENWNFIDGWSNGEGFLNRERVIDHKRIQANRKYISTNMAKLSDEIDKEKADRLKEKIRERIEELFSAGEKVSEETITRLKVLGIE